MSKSTSKLSLHKETVRSLRLQTRIRTGEGGPSGNGIQAALCETHSVTDCPATFFECRSINCGSANNGSGSKANSGPVGGHKVE